jgi:ketosteroid isomerase-like protein
VNSALQRARILVLTLRDGRVVELTGFLDPAVLRKVPAVPMSS